MATQPDFTCATCDVAITHHPTFHLGLAFCCAGCAADGPCMCSYDVEAHEPAVAPAPAVVVMTSPVVDRVPVVRPAAATRVPERVPAGAASSLAAARR
jgi:hypothetical protein